MCYIEDELGDILDDQTQSEQRQECAYNSLVSKRNLNVTGAEAMLLKMESFIVSGPSKLLISELLNQMFHCRLMYLFITDFISLTDGEVLTMFQDLFWKYIYYISQGGGLEGIWHL